MMINLLLLTQELYIIIFQTIFIKKNQWNSYLFYLIGKYG